MELGEILVDHYGICDATVYFEAPRNAPTRDNGPSKLQKIYRSLDWLSESKLDARIDFF